MTTLRDVDGAIRRPQIDWSAMYAGPPVNGPDALGVAAGEDLVPATAAQVALLSTARPYQLRFIASTGRLYWLDGQPERGRCVWRALRVPSAGTADIGAGLGSDFMLAVATAENAQVQRIPVHVFNDTDPVGYPNGGLHHPVIYDVLCHLSGSQYSVIDGGPLDRVAVSPGLLQGIVSVTVNGIAVPLACESAYAGGAMLAQSWYTAMAWTTLGWTMHVQFQAPGPTGINTGSRILCAGDIVEISAVKLAFPVVAGLT